jgi:hypothetical protein
VPQEEDYKFQRAGRGSRHVFSPPANGRKRRVSLRPPSRRTRANRKGQCVCEGKWEGGPSSGQGGPAHRSRGPGGGQRARYAGSRRVDSPLPPSHARAHPAPPSQPPSSAPARRRRFLSPPPNPGSGGPRYAGPHRVSPAGRCLGRLRGLAYPAAAHQHPAARRGHQPALQRLQVPRPPEEQGELIRRRGGAAGERRAGPGRGPRASSRRSWAVPALGSSSRQPRTRPSPPGPLAPGASHRDLPSWCLTLWSPIPEPLLPSSDREPVVAGSSNTVPDLKPLAGGPGIRKPVQDWLSLPLGSSLSKTCRPTPTSSPTSPSQTLKNSPLVLTRDPPPDGPCQILPDLRKGPYQILGPPPAVSSLGELDQPLRCGSTLLPPLARSPQPTSNSSIPGSLKTRSSCPGCV